MDDYVSMPCIMSEVETEDEQVFFVICDETDSPFAQNGQVSSCSLGGMSCEIQSTNIIIMIDGIL